jgi:hypothetical protein
MAKSKSGIYLARDTFHTEVDGVPTVVTKGELVTADSAVYKGREALFESVEDKARPEVEEATNEPGKKRGAV